MATTGTTTVDFGAFPGKPDAAVAVTGQTAIVPTSLVEAWIRPVATADHSDTEHMVETIKVIAADILAGVGFTIYAFNTGQLNEPLEGAGAGGSGGILLAGRSTGYAAPERGGTGTRLYGQFTVAWVWN